MVFLLQLFEDRVNLCFVVGTEIDFCSVYFVVHGMVLYVQTTVTTQNWHHKFMKSVLNKHKTVAAINLHDIEQQ